MESLLGIYSAQRFYLGPAHLPRQLQDSKQATKIWLKKKVTRRCCLMADRQLGEIYWEIKGEHLKRMSPSGDIWKREKTTTGNAHLTWPTIIIYISLSLRRWGVVKKLFQ